MKLVTDRLILRSISLDDKNDVFKYRSDTEINKYQGWIPKTINDVETFINKISKQINEPGTWYQFVIIEKKNHKIIGDLGIHFFDIDNKQVEIGCTLNKDFQSKGYATESVSGIIDYLFKELNKHRIITSIDPENKNAIRLIERIGFRKEILKGKGDDDLIFALYRKDWNI